MQFTTFTLSALTVAAVSATTTHVVTVGNKNGTLAYSPDSVKASVGDLVQFQFMPANHTVTQSTFDQPCEPIADNSNVTGIYSGFMAVSASDTTIPTYTVEINNTTPIWIYCSQGKHCQKGMNLVINENTAKNATRSLANYKLSAAKATSNLPGISVSNGTSGTTTVSSTDNTTSTTTSSSSSATTSSSDATAIKAINALSLGGLLALGMALFI